MKVDFFQQLGIKDQERGLIQDTFTFSHVFCNRAYNMKVPRKVIKRCLFGNLKFRILADESNNAKKYLDPSLIQMLMKSLFQDQLNFLCMIRPKGHLAHILSQV